MKQFTSIKDVSDPMMLINLALELKKSPLSKEHLGKGKMLGLLFFNPSLRTRLSTQKAAQNLGMQVMMMNLNQDGWAIELEDGTVMNKGTQEHIKEAAGVLSQYCNIIGIRTFPELKNREEDYNEIILNKFIQHTTVPIISLESATLHPLQSLADCMTILEHNITRPKVVLTWAPHPKPLPQAVANSFLEWMKQMPVDLVLTHPEKMDLSPEYTNGITINYSQKEALKNADFVYAKNWSSYSNYGSVGDHQDWTIDSNKMNLTNNAKFMHCLPVRRNVVVTDEVLDSDQSIVLQQANNRTYSAQAVLHNLLQHEN